MKILLTVPAYLAYSYVNQAQALKTGFSELNIDNQLFKANNPGELIQQLNRYHPDYVIGVGNWTEFDLFVKTPATLGYHYLPWIVTDEDRITKYVAEYNQSGPIVTPSRHCYQNFVNSGLKSNLIHVIPEAVDPAFWRPLSEPELLPFLQNMTIPITNPNPVNQWDMVNIHQSHIPVIYTTGGDATKKGAQEVIWALSTLDPSLPWIYIIKSWPVAVVFRRSAEELELAQSLSIANRIRYISAELSEEYMRGLMNICDIYAAPSRIEGFGLPHVEAQMCGKPVISLASTATEETVIHGQTGFHAQRDLSEKTFPKADIKDLAQHLQQLITDSTARQKMGQNALAHARTNYSPKVIAQKFLDLIAQLN